MNDLILKDDAYKIVGACFAGRKIILKKAMAIACIAFCGLFCFSQEVEFKIDKISLSEDKGKAELELSLKNLTDNKYSISIRNMSIIIRGVDEDGKEEDLFSFKPDKIDSKYPGIMQVGNQPLEIKKFVLNKISIVLPEKGVLYALITVPEEMAKLKYCGMENITGEIRSSKYSYNIGDNPEWQKDMDFNNKFILKLKEADQE